MSWVSVVFDFNDSLNDVAPMSPMLLSVSVKRKKKRVNCWLMSFCMSSFVFTIQIEFCECCVWFQCFTQWCYSCVFNLVVCWWEEKEKERIPDGWLLCVFFCLYDLGQLLWVYGLISMLRSTTLIPYHQCCYLLVRWHSKTTRQTLEWTKTGGSLFFFILDLPNWALDMKQCSSQVQHAQSCILPWHTLQNSTYRNCPFGLLVKTLSQTL